MSTNPKLQCTLEATVLPFVEIFVTHYTQMVFFSFHWDFAWPIQTWCSNNNNFLPTKYKYIHVSFTIHAVLYNKKLQKNSYLLKLYFVDINLLEKMLFICFKVQISMASNWWVLILFYDISDEEDLDEEVRFPWLKNYVVLWQV